LSRYERFRRKFSIFAAKQLHLCLSFAKNFGWLGLLPCSALPLLLPAGRKNPHHDGTTLGEARHPTWQGRTTLGRGCTSIWKQIQH